MSENPLLRLKTFGQSIWLDTIRRGMLTPGGELERLIANDGLCGVTSNPAIFEKAIDGSNDYDDAIRGLARQGKGLKEIYETLAVEDVGCAADRFRELYDRSGGADGFVSLEVSPSLAHDTQATVAEARHLWARLNRPNVLIKVPGTREGLPAVRQLISEGVNVNVTLLFAVARYEEVAGAYFAGLESRSRPGRRIDRVASVASFFLSRIDVLLDPQFEKVIQAGGPRAELARAMLGQIAIDSARLAYRKYEAIYAARRWRKLAGQGAMPQRLLWASTGTKTPEYSDVMYVEALIGPNTVNTLPLETLEAYRSHGTPAARLEEDVAGAERRLRQLPDVGIDLAAVTRQLEDEGVQKFIVPFDKLMSSLEAKRKAALGSAQTG
jgi:transaldolase